MYFINGTFTVMGVSRCIPPALGLASLQGGSTDLEQCANHVEDEIWVSYRQFHASALLYYQFLCICMSCCAHVSCSSVPCVPCFRKQRAVTAVC